MKQINWFAVKISLFNALGYGIATGTATYVDPLLKSNLGHGAVTYPMGFWILLPMPLVFAGSFLAETRCSKIIPRVVLPGLMIAVPGLLSLLNFYKMGFHIHVIQWTLMYTVGSILTSWIRHSPDVESRIDDSSISDKARIEWIKEYVMFWRTLTFAIVGGYIAILFYWLNYIAEDAKRFIVNDAERNLLISFLQGEIWIFTIYMILCPTIESFRKTAVVADLLLSIKSKTQHE
jgi:hypothetical protein